ncbi:uncharacterized protein LOC108090594 [Drosophila ficusphila]|uniref:uncharacterized protein LOC108090594 n=1 Tax=Drosophila ficusphila TaxID=30025 RepID=UPI0007E7ECB2|nr:uncharacterized protein LOC108090594 [Drosophila ficusphila]
MEGENSVKGILKSGANSAQLSLKAAKFDELNILETFHPPGKDYGHMVIDEPKTPFVFEDDIPKELDMSALIEKLRLTSKSEMPAFGIEGDSDDSSADEDFPESIEEKVRRMEFEKRRKLHYKEFFSVSLARRLIAEEFADTTTSDISIHSEGIIQDSDLICETCPSSEREQSVGTASKAGHSDNVSGFRSPEQSFVSEPEPGFSPSHHCYQKLQAELYSHGPHEYASLTHLHHIPSVNDSDLHKELKVPNVSVITSVRPTVRDSKISTIKPAPRICKTTSKTSTP